MQRFITTIKSVTAYTHTHIQTPVSKIKTVQQKIQQLDPVNKGNLKLYLPEQNYLKHKLENKTKARGQVGNKEMKAKLQYIERKEKK